MKKIVLFSLFLILGLVGSQTLPTLVGVESYSAAKPTLDFMLYTCLAFIMINVGRDLSSTRAVGAATQPTTSLQWRQPQLLG